MAKKKKDSIEYRYYEIGQDECVLALFGESWIRDYGHDVDGFHFHNLMEVGVCHEGRGDMSYEEGNVPYAPGTITVIPRNLPHVTIIRRWWRRAYIPMIRFFGGSLCPGWKKST